MKPGRPPPGCRRAAAPTLAALALLLGAGAAAASTQARLEDRLRRALEPLGGAAGVAVVHVESGRQTSLVIGASRFPMASVYKLPIAVAVLRRVDRGQLRLDHPVTLTARDFRPGAAALALPPGTERLRVPVSRLIELSIARSDNTASDALLRLVGGPEAVTRILLDLGISGIEVSRYEARMMADWHGVEDLPHPGAWSRERLEQLFASVPAGRRRAAAARFSRDGRDTATPEAVADLLVRLQRGRVLSPASTAFLLGAMRRTDTGPGRLRGRLPPGTVVAHKTGTLGTIVNDAGLITLPGGRGHLAVAVLLKDSRRPRARSERAIAEVARVAYDYYAGTAAPAPRRR